MPTREEKIAEIERLRKIEEIKVLRAQAEAEIKPLKMTEVESTALGAIQGGTAGFADEGEGVLRAGKEIIFGDAKFENAPGLYRERRDAARARYEKARQDNPTAYTIGEVGGTIATTAIPAGGLIKGAGRLGKILKSKAGTASVLGAAGGLGLSDADLTKGEMGRAAEDTAWGAGVGLGMHGLTSALGGMVKKLTPTEAAKKLSNVFLNTPEELTETYIQNPQGVLNAPRRFELANKYEDTLEGLKKEVVEGSKASREILKAEGKTFSGDDLAAIYTNKADELENAAEGVMTDPQKIAAVKFLRDTAEKFKGGVDADGNPLPKVLSTNRIKDELQTLDRMTDYDIGKGQFGRIDDQVKKDVRSSIDQSLKGQSPAYAKQMEGVAKDSKLLDEASNIAKSPQGLASAFRKLETDQYGGGQMPREVLKQLDERMGTTFVDDAKMAMTREAFDKSITNGSMNVNKFANLLKDTKLAPLAPLVGASVDKYGRKMTMEAVDTAVKLNQLYQRDNVQSFVQAAKPIVDAAKKGNPAAVLTFQFFSESNPEALRFLEPNNPMQRRLEKEK